MTLKLVKILAIPVCILVIMKIAMALQNLNEALERVDSFDQEQTVWAATQIDNSITDFRRVVLYELYAPNKMEGNSLSLEFDIFYSRLGQVSDPVIRQILQNTNLPLPLDEVAMAKTSIAAIFDSPESVSTENLFHMYSIASDLQEIWSPYKFAILQLAREEKFKQLEAAREALTSARNSVIIGAVFVIITLGLVFVNFHISRRSDALEDKLRHDPLTGSLSRSGFFDRVMEAEQLVGLAVVDLNSLKAVNDTMGHDTGDALLKATAATLSNIISQTGFVARAGGDEFWLASYLPSDELREILSRAAEQILEKFPDYMKVTSQFPISYGVCELQGYSSLDDALRAADLEMYKMKNGFWVEDNIIER